MTACNGSDSDYYRLFVEDYSERVNQLYVAKDSSVFVYHSDARDGYEFLGLYDENGTQYVDAHYRVKEKLSDGLYLYEKWYEVLYGTTYRASFVIDGQYDTETPAAITMKVGFTIENFPQITAPEHYTFLGWFSEDGEIQYSDGNTLLSGYTEFHLTNYAVNEKTTSVLLYAKFKGDKFTLSYAGTGTEGLGNTKVEYGTNYSSPVPERTGYTFLGWYDGPNDGATALTDSAGKSLGQYMIAQNSILYAKWTLQRCVVTFETNGGTQLSSVTYFYGDKITAPKTNPVRSDFMFSGWYADEDFTQEFEFGTEISGDVTIYAKWRQSTAISTAEELIAATQNPDLDYHLTADINLGARTFTPFGDFTGTFEGFGHKIYNFTLKNSGAYTAFGFFCTNSGTIQNVVLEGVIASASSTAKKLHSFGVLAGINYGKIENCSVSGEGFTVTVTVSDGSSTASYLRLGGLVGDNSEGTVTNCSTNIDITADVKQTCTTSSGTYGGYFDVGGICGSNSGRLSYCSYSGTIFVTPQSLGHKQNLNYNYAASIVYTRVGGAVSVNRATGEIYRCSVDTENDDFVGVPATYTDATGYGSNETRTGGFCAVNLGSIEESFANTVIKSTGSVSYNGGFVAENMEGGEIRNCYANPFMESLTGGKIAAYTGGFAGSNAGTIACSYVSGVMYVLSASSNLYILGSFVGENAATGIIRSCLAAGFTIAIENATQDFFTFGFFAGKNSGTCSAVYYMMSESNMKYNFGEGVDIQIDCDEGERTWQTEGYLDSADFYKNAPMYWDSTVWDLDNGEYQYDSLLPLLLWQQQ